MYELKDKVRRIWCIPMCAGGQGFKAFVKIQCLHVEYKINGGDKQTNKKNYTFFFFLNKNKSKDLLLVAEVKRVRDATGAELVGQSNTRINTDHVRILHVWH